MNRVDGNLARSTSRQTGRATFRTVVLVMPFGPVWYPDLGCSSLKAVFHDNDRALDVKYCNIDFAMRIGIQRYRLLENMCDQYLLSEYPFATALREDAPAFTEFMKAVLPDTCGRPFGAVQSLNFDVLPPVMEGVVAKVNPYLDVLEESLDLSDYEIIGFTTSYAQNSAAWAFARRVRRRYPAATIVFGGANCEGEMGQAQVDTFDFIDYACTGEGEVAFLRLVKWLEDPKNNDFPHNGIVSRDKRLNSPLQSFVDVAKLPIPDYSDYFAQLEQHAEWPRMYRALPVESSRGCWWGQKQRCVFCGLNGRQLSYRHKPAERFVQELREARRQYGERAKYIQVTDNIMPYNYFDEFLPLVKDERPYDTMFYEIKSNLTPDRLLRLRNAGITFLQPGIESLSTPVLKIMRKGVTAIANVQTLKWATELGIRLVWSILYGFPGEKAESYDEMAALISKIYHLTPPSSMNRISIQRYSLLQENASEFGLHLAPAIAYTHLYGFPETVASRLAYWFEDRNGIDTAKSHPQFPDYVQACRRQFHIWQKTYLRRKTVRLDYEAVDGEWQVFDSRTGTAKEEVLRGVDRAVALATLEIATITNIMDAVRRTMPGADMIAVKESLERLVDSAYVMREGGKYLCLAVNRAEWKRREPSNFWLDRHLGDQGYSFV